MGNNGLQRSKENKGIKSEIIANDRKFSIMRQTTRLIQEKSDILQDIDKEKVLQVQKTIMHKTSEVGDISNEETAPEIIYLDQSVSKKILKKKQNFITKEYLKVSS